MDAYKELLDFKSYEKKVPCPLCGKDSVPTVIGNHFKCPNDDHLFNQDGSPLPEGVECHCEQCIPKQPEVEELNPKLLSKLKKKIASVKKKLKGKAKNGSSFTFDVINERNSKSYSFKVFGILEDEFCDTLGCSDGMDKLTKSLEQKYNGVLDWHGNGVSSYEIKPKDFLKVLKEFRNWFEQKGYKTK